MPTRDEQMTHKAIQTLIRGVPALVAAAERIADAQERTAKSLEDLNTRDLARRNEARHNGADVAAAARDLAGYVRSHLAGHDADTELKWALGKYDEARDG